MRIQGIDHVEYYTRDLEGTATAFCDVYGFRIAARSHPGQDASAQRSALLRQGQIQLLVTACGTAEDPAARYVARHGDGVAVIAFRTADLRQAFAEVVAGGAVPVSWPEFQAGSSGQIGTAVVSGFGDVLHKLVERDCDEEFAPGSLVMEPGEDPDAPDQHGTLLELLDHIAVCLPAGELERTVSFYRDAFGLEQIYDERIEVGSQAMASKVVQDHAAKVTFTLIEPDVSREPGQIDEFLRAHGGAGVQHLAFRTGDIAAAVAAISGRGAEFLVAPPGYYQALGTRLGPLAIPIEVLRGLNILADTDRWGQMFQIFARSTHQRHTFFIELIERQGALTFGSRNIRALYEALDDEHAGIKH